MKTMFV